MSGAEIAIRLLELVATVAPGVLAAVAGTETDRDAIDAARDIAERLPQRTGAGGAWDEDLDERKRRG